MAKNNQHIKDKEETMQDSETVNEQLNSDVSDNQDGVVSEEIVADEENVQSEGTENANQQTEPENKTDNESENNQADEALAKMTLQFEDMKDKYLRLSAEFDNYRKRTLKEKMELTKSAGQSILLNILPVVDNFERALKSVEASKDIEAVKDGIHLIYATFSDFLKQQGINAIDAVNQEFNTDEHEAITKIPAPAEELKGKVVDVVEKGYKLHDKVIRFAKVVVGE